MQLTKSARFRKKKVEFREIDWDKGQNFVNYRNLIPFCQVNYLYELSPGSEYPTQKWYKWASFQTSRKRFRKLQEAIWLTVINEIFKFPPRLGPFCQINYLSELFSGYPSYSIQKWYIWASFQNSRKRFRKLQEAIWLTVINEIFKVLPHFDLFSGKLFL